jgi:hypothetical protein
LLSSSYFPLFSFVLFSFLLLSFFSFF